MYFPLTFSLFTVARVAEGCYVLVALFFYFLKFFFRPQIFRRPWADFRETLPHDVVCPEIFLSQSAR